MRFGSHFWPIWRVLSPFLDFRAGQMRFGPRFRRFWPVLADFVPFWRHFGHILAILSSLAEIAAETRAVWPEPPEITGKVRSDDFVRRCMGMRVPAFLPELRKNTLNRAFWDAGIPQNVAKCD